MTTYMTTGAGANSTKSMMLTPSDAAHQIGVSRDTVIRLCESGDIAAINVSSGRYRRFRISAAALAAFIEARTSTKAAS